NGSLGPVEIDVTPPTTTVSVDDPNGDNAPTASGTTEPGTLVEITWPDGTTSQVTADGDTGEWSVTAPAAQPSGDIDVSLTDPAGNTGSAAGSWTAVTIPPDTTAPDTTDTSVTVGTIAGDNVVNAAEAAGNVS